MRNLLTTLCLLLPSAAFASGLAGSGPAPVIPCTATPPAQAIAAGLSNLVRCDSFSSSAPLSVDVNDTRAAGYDWYASSPVISQATTPPQNFTTDGTGLELIAPGSSGTLQPMPTTGRSASPPYYVGNQIRGSYYTEIDMVFNKTIPTSSLQQWPAFWQTGGHYKPNGALDATQFPMLEMDFFECLAGGSSGGNCAPQINFHVWTDVSNTLTEKCSGPGGSITNVTNTYSTYGFLWLQSTDNAGTGLMKWYYNNSLVATCTYTSSTFSCDNGALNGTCLGSDMIAGESMDQMFQLATGYPSWPMTVRNFHMWQH